MALKTTGVQRSTMLASSSTAYNLEVPPARGGPVFRARRFAIAATTSMAAVAVIAFFSVQIGRRPEADLHPTNGTEIGQETPQPRIVLPPSAAETVHVDVPNLPEGAVVLVDGVEVPALPVALPKGPGKHLVAVRVPGTPGEKAVTIEATRDQEILFEVDASSSRRVANDAKRKPKDNRRIELRRTPSSTGPGP